MTSKEQVLDKAITDIQTEIMFAWRAVMMYEEQLRNIQVYKKTEKELHQLISDEKFKIEILTSVLNMFEPPAPEEFEVEAAKEILQRAGYHTPALWHLRDVTDKYECDEDTAWHILHEVIDKSIWRINDYIDEMAQEHELKSK